MPENEPRELDDTESPKLRPTPMRVFFNAAHLYRLRVREQPLQEVLAMLGIAAGVALLFAVQVANTSITGGLSHLTRGVIGNASVELAARGQQGMDQGIVAKAQRLESVRAAAPVLQQRITVVGPQGEEPLTLVGVDERLRRTGGSLVRNFSTERRDLSALGLFLTTSTAKAIGAERGTLLSIETGGQKRELPLAGTLGTRDIGDLVDSPVALAPLGLAQRIANMPGRISRVLIEPKTGMDAARDLRALAANRFDVRPSDSEADLLAEALKPDQQSSALFSAIAVVIGMLFAYNAMLLVMARRRRMVAYLRMIGADKPTVLATIAIEALVLGLAAALVGVLLGDLLSHFAFQSIPKYLTSGFPIGMQRVVETQTIVVSVAGGLAAAFLASAMPAFDLYRVDPGEAVREPMRSGEDKPLRGSKALWSGLAIVAAASILASLSSSLAPLGIPGVIVGFVLVLGPVLAHILEKVHRVTRMRGGIGLALAVDELNGSPRRATALAVIAASAVTAILAIGGARLDLERGVGQLNRDLYGTAQLWVVPGGQANVFLTQPFDPRPALDRLNKQANVRTVGVAYGSFLDVGHRRLRVIALPAHDPRPLAQSQVVNGDPALATKRIRSGGWIALSKPVAQALGQTLGGTVVLPTPTGNRRFRLAATTANYGWPSGGIVMNADDYKKAWQRESASALSVNLAPGTTLNAGKRSVQAALGADSALRVQTADEMVQERALVLVQGLARLRQISTLVLGAATLAIIAAMFAAVWQRRTRLASLRALGMYRSELYRTLFAETSLIVLLGGACGFAFGLYCQVLASRWTEVTSGYRMPFEPAIGLGIVTLAEAMVLAAIATAGPAYFASKIAPRVNEET